MGARSKARKRALDVLYEADLRDEDPRAVVRAALARPSAPDVPPLPPYAVELVDGVCDHREQIDALLADYAEGWTLERMPAVDRNVLRLGLLELLWHDEVPDGVAVSEAVELAADLSTPDSPRWVNGVLGRLARDQRGAGTGSAVELDGPPRLGADHAPADELVGERER